MRVILRVYLRVNSESSKSERCESLMLEVGESGSVYSNGNEKTPI